MKRKVDLLAVALLLLQTGSPSVQAMAEEEAIPMDGDSTPGMASP
jgi:hypothetical protein